MKLITYNLQLKTQKLRFKIVLLLSVVCCLLFISSPVSADWNLLQYVNVECTVNGLCGVTDFLRLGRGVSELILKFVGVVALIFFIIGGIVWITSSGNQERVKQGKKMMTGTIIGIFIVLLAWQIVNLVICGVSKGQIAGTCNIFGTAWNVFPKDGEGPGAVAGEEEKEEYDPDKPCVEDWEGECLDACDETNCTPTIDKKCKTGLCGGATTRLCCIERDLECIKEMEGTCVDNCQDHEGECAEGTCKTRTGGLCGGNADRKCCVPD